MHITPDEIILWQRGVVTINGTLLYTWLAMAVLAIASWRITRRLSIQPRLSPWQNLLEVLLNTIQKQIQEISGQDPKPFLPFVGTLFIFIATANVLGIVPGYHPPTSSLSTTAALALCVFLAVPFYGIRQQGLVAYLKHYLQPSPILLPFHIIGELSRTLALAVRLFGNVMSEGLIVAILLAIAPLFLPALMQVLGLLTGLIQAYIFAILAMVYIASALQAHQEKTNRPLQKSGS